MAKKITGNEADVGTAWPNNENTLDSEVGSPAPSSKRRAVACQHCHSLKVKCVPLDENDKTGPCQRCAKSKKECVIDFTQARKRKSRTVATPANSSARIKQLEDHIAELSKMASKLQQLNNEQSMQINEQRSIITNLNRNPGSDKVSPVKSKKSNGSRLQSKVFVPSTDLGDLDSRLLNHKRNGGSVNNESFAAKITTPQMLVPLFHEANSPISTISSTHSAPLGVEDSAWNGTQARVALLKNDIEALTQLQEESFSNSSHEIVMLSEKRFELMADKLNPASFDIIANGWLTEDQCQSLLDHFMNIVLPSYPAIEMPQNPTVAQIQKTEPRLFLAIMHISCMTKDVAFPIPLELQMRLEQLLCEVLFREIYCVGAKTLELLRAVLISTAWYSSAELFHQRRYHLLNVLCVSLVQDLGLTGRPYFFYNKDEKSVRRGGVSDVTETVESKTLVLVVYSMSVCIALFLRRRIPVQWTEYVQECCSDLERLNDKKLSKIALYVRLSSVLEKSQCKIHTPGEPIAIGDYVSGRHQYIVKELEDELNSISSKIFQLFKDDAGCFNSLMAFYYSVQVHVHEPSMHRVFAYNSRPAVEENVDLPEFLVDSLEKCAISCIYALRHFEKLDKTEMTMLPLFFLSRMIYTAGVLLRLRYASLHIPLMAKFSFLTNDAVHCIHNLHKKIYECSLSYPRNHFWLKMRLVVGLFTQTYATQCYSMLHSNNEQAQPGYPNTADTVYQTENSPFEAAVPTISVQKDVGSSQNNTQNQNSGMQPQNPGTPLDILAQAAEHHERQSQSPGGPTNNFVDPSIPHGNHTRHPPPISPNDTTHGAIAHDVDPHANPNQLLGFGLLNTHKGGFNSRKSFSAHSVPGVSPGLNPELKDLDNADLQYWLLNDEVWSDLLVPTEGMQDLHNFKPTNVAPRF